MAYTTIKKPSDYFNTKLYTGNGGTNAITGVGFAPDLVWQKRRDALNGHVWFDNVRGATKIVQSDSNGVEITSTSGNDTISLDSDGFTVGVPSQTGGINPNGASCVAWNWLANGTGSSNTDGSITSTVSANTTSGFSIVSYTGTGSQATVGHGLGATPKWIIIKRLQNLEDWAVYHASNGAGTYQSLNTTEPKQTNSNRFNVAPTSSVFTVNTHESVNFAENYIAYCFAEKQGFSKFGSYVGNGSNTDGTFVYTGFKPAFVMVKNTTVADSWQITDHPRDADVSPNYSRLMANFNNGEGNNQTWAKIEKFSNGFKLGYGDNVINASGSTYIYMAFAEEPLVGDNPCTAR